MSSARPVEEPLAETLSAAPFVRVAAASDGDSLAAAGLLARACAGTDTPFQFRLDDAPDTENGVTVTVGPTAVDGDATLDRPASPTAFELARRLGTDPDPVLALAGTIAAGETVQSADTALEAARDAALIDRQPGLALPTDDVPTGIAASTLLHGPFSGDEEAAAALVAELDAGAGDDAGNGKAFDRRLASLVAVDTVTAEGATERAATQVERALRPYVTPDAPFRTLGGYADVLDAVARTAPAAGISLALGEGSDDATDAALAAWRKYGAAVHDGLRSATTRRHHGVWLLELEADPAVLPAIARLARAFRSPEPVALAVTDGAAAAAGDSGIDDAVAAATRAVDGTGHGTDTTGWARFDSDTEQFTDAFREAL
ncbi:exonuclease RecJ [Halolamina sp. C58]|uniref:exonuclease RecJ n=1 Tax=Halolamina sp. C58 TaxID=3421640 RepID=UPI003EB96A23